MLPRKKTGLQRAAKRLRIIEKALKRGAHPSSIARRTRTSTRYVQTVHRQMKQQRLVVIPIQAPHKRTLKSLGFAAKTGEHGARIGSLGEEFVQKFFRGARRVDKQGVDIEIPTKSGPIRIEVKTIAGRDSEALLKIPVRNMRWTNTACDKLIVLTTESMIFMDKADLNSFIRDFYLHHPKMSRRRDYLLLLSADELVKLHYATRTPIIGFARKRKDLGKILAQIRREKRKIGQAKKNAAKNKPP